MATATVYATQPVQVGIALGSPFVSGQPVTIPIVVTNTGTAAATISSVVVLSPGAGVYNINPPVIPSVGLTLQAGQSVTMQSSAVFYPNLHAAAGLPPSIQYNIQYQVNFSDGSSAQSTAVSVAPLISVPGEAAFFLPSQSGVTLVFGGM